MHAYRPGAGQARTKLLYLFRSPSHVQIGRKPLDPEVREALEHTHPDLTFDWNGLLRDSPPIQRQTRQDPRERDRNGRNNRPQKPAGRQQGRSEERPARPAPPAVELPDDDSALGQALGAAEAARLRHRYAELVQRVGRRARTPEDRDRLMAELVVVNPDEWAGPDVIRERARGADRVMDGIAAQLPKRRRGRRGGQTESGPKTDGTDQAPGADVIIGERDNTDDEETHHLAVAPGDGRDRHSDRPVDAAPGPVADDTEADLH